MIEAMALRKSYGGVAAVDGLSFSVRPGHVTGFLGPNGAGKSTTMRLMLELDRGGGRTTFGGLTYGELSAPMSQVGALLEARAFHPTRSARNHLRMLAAAGGLPPARADEVLEMVGLASVARRGPRGFSLGMGQRLGLAAALLGDPEFLVLDEPANGLDPHGVAWLRDLLRSFAAEGRTVLVSSHLLGEMALLADRLVVLARGRLVSETATDSFVSQFSETSVVVRTPEAPRLTELVERRGGTVAPEENGRLTVTGTEQAELAELAMAEGIVLHELTTQVATLEQAYMQATADDQQYLTRPRVDAS